MHRRLLRSRGFLNTDIMSCDPDELVDLRDVRIGTALPVKKAGNPYLFKVDHLIAKAAYLR